MNITVTTPIAPKFKELFNVTIKTYHGDADGDGFCSFAVSKADIARVVMEIMVVKHQFSGRGGCRVMYDQCHYFLNRNDYDDLSFYWLDPEHGYPYDHNGGEQNHTLDSFGVNWFDANGTKYNVKLDCMLNAKMKNEILQEITALNTKHQIGVRAVWGELNYDDPLYTAYRLDAVALVQKLSANVAVVFA